MNTQTECRLFIAEHAEHVPRLLEFSRAIGLKVSPCTDPEVLAALGDRGSGDEVILEVTSPGLDVGRFLLAFRDLATATPITCLSGFESAHALLLVRSGSWSHPGAGSALDFAEALQLVRVCSAVSSLEPRTTHSERGNDTKMSRSENR